MTDDEIRYRGFLVIWKVLGQTRPGITYEERFIIAILATSDDRFERAKRVNPRKVGELRRIRAKSTSEDPIFDPI